MSLSSGGRWSTEKIVKFLQIYKKQECLWNAKMKDYKNRTAREYAIVQMIIHMEDPDLTPVQVKDKIRSLRTTFCAEVNKINRMRKEGYDYKPKLSWFSKLEFILHDKDDDDETDESIKEDRPAPTSSSPTDFQMKLESYDDCSSPGRLVEAPSSPPTKVKKKHHTSTHREKAKPCFVSTNTFNETDSYREEDEFEVFSRNVALQLQRLPLKYALEAQEQIQRVLKEQRIKAIDDEYD